MSTDPMAFFENEIAGRQPSAESVRSLFERLWKAHAQAIFAYAFARLRNREDACDVCSQTFLKAMRWADRHPGQWPNRVNFPAWLQRIAQRAVLDIRKHGPGKTGRAQSLGHDEDEGVGGTVPDPRAERPEENSERRERLEALRECLEHLPPQRRRILRMHQTEDLTFAEIGR